VETMCTAAYRFVDHTRHAREPTRELCGNLLEQWSALLCLAMYKPVSSDDSGSEAR
jgi:hypothetical protein